MEEVFQYRGLPELMPYLPDYDFRMEEVGQNWESESQPLNLNDEAPLPLSFMIDDFRFCKPVEEVGQNWKPEFQPEGLPELMRDSEVRLPLEYMWDDDFPLLEEFIATHREQLTMLTAECDDGVLFWNYSDLTFLIHLVREYPVLYIIDFHRSEVIEKIKKFRSYKLGGSWFDSLESHMVDNEQNDYEHMEKLRIRELELERENNIVLGQLDLIRYMLKKSDLTRECFEIFLNWFKEFEQQQKLIESDLANVMEKKKAVSDARQSLNYFYQ